MPTEALHGLTQYCKRRAGRSLRGVFTYTEDGGTVVYAREDLRDVYDGEDVDKLFEVAWQLHTTVLEQAPRVETIGAYRATVHTFDDAFVIQFRESETEGIAVVLERQIGKDLHSFLLECEAYLD